MEKMQPIDLIQKIETNVPEIIKNCPQWVLWKYDYSLDPQHPKKPPFDAKNGQPASSTNPATWASYETAISAYLSHSHNYNGLGFILTLETGLIVIDLDNCYLETNGSTKRTLKPIALQIAQLAASYTEKSPSNNGLHIWMQGKILGEKRKGQIAEMYQDGRYITITGNRVGSPTEVTNNQDALDMIYDIAFPPENRPEPRNASFNFFSLSTPDDEVKRKAETARNGYKFSRLWRGDISAYPKDNSTTEYDKSRADLALCSMLAYWTNKNFNQIERLFRSSGLYLNYPETRKKWREIHYNTGETYGEHTIRQAIEELRQF